MILCHNLVQCVFVDFVFSTETMQNIVKVTMYVTRRFTENGPSEITLIAFFVFLLSEYKTATPLFQVSSTQP